MTANSRPVPVRMPEDLYQEIVASKPPELKLSTYLLTLIRKGLSAPVDICLQNVDTFHDDALFSRIDELEEQMQEILKSVDDACAVRDASVESALQRILEDDQLLDVRIQEVVEQHMQPVLPALGESNA